MFMLWRRYFYFTRESVYYTRMVNGKSSLGLFALTQKELTKLWFRDFRPSIYSRRAAKMHLIGNTAI